MREKDILCLSFLGLLFLFTPIKGSWCVSIIIILRMRIGFPGLKIRESLSVRRILRTASKWNDVCQSVTKRQMIKLNSLGCERHLPDTTSSYEWEVFRFLLLAFLHTKINDWRKPGNQIMREIISKKNKRGNRFSYFNLLQFTQNQTLSEWVNFLTKPTLLPSSSHFGYLFEANDLIV